MGSPVPSRVLKRGPGTLSGVVGVAALLLGVFCGPVAAEYQLKPFKDKLFAYPGVLETKDDGAFLRVDYNERRDLDERDAIKEQRVRSDYVSLKPRWSEQTLKFKAGGRTIKFIATGKTRGARMAVIYIHGQGGNRFQGSNDWRFGGNFNRIKNLMTRNDGLFISTDFSDFGTRGKDEVKQLMQLVAANSPGAPIFVACGSMGGAICWRLSEDPEAAPLLGGLLFLGSMWNNDFFKMPMLTDKSRWVPIYFGHGSADSVFPWQSQKEFFEKIRRAAPGYPVKFVLFETGSHGTPIRMTDWRAVLNWMLSVNG